MPRHLCVGEYKSRNYDNEIKLVGFSESMTYLRNPHQMSEPSCDSEHAKQSFLQKSRKDDLKQLVYLMVYLETQNENMLNPNILYGPDLFLKSTGCLHYLEFAEAIWKYKFKEKPYYDKLRFMLTKVHLEAGK